MNSTVCLIGGTGRSGTTILQKIFARHPDLTDVQEWRFLIDPDGIIDFIAGAGIWSPYHYDLKVKRLKRLLSDVALNPPRRWLYRRLRRWGILQKLPWNLEPRYADIAAKRYCPNFLELVDGLVAELIQFRYSGYWVGMERWQRQQIFYGEPLGEERLISIFRDFLKQIIRSVLEHQGVSHYLEKNTWNILYFDMILQLLPESKMVHIYRDPRDVVASFVQERWMPSDPVECAKVYRDIMNQWYLIRGRIPPDTFLELSLESLVARPEETLRSISRFWGIPWNGRLLELDLSKSHTGRWKKDIPLSLQKEVQRILQPHIEILGYGE